MMINKLRLIKFDFCLSSKKCYFLTIFIFTDYNSLYLRSRRTKSKVVLLKIVFSFFVIYCSKNL